MEVVIPQQELPVSVAPQNLLAPAATPVQEVDVVARIFSGKNPSLLVFDCDFTIWPFDCDKHVISPFRALPFGGIIDRFGRPANPFRDVQKIFAGIVDAGIPVAFLSRNPSAVYIEELLRCIMIYPKTKPLMSLWDTMPSREYFHAYSRDGVGKGKDKHFAALQKASNIPFHKMLFFDDLPENILAAQAQGTTAVLVGVTRGLNVEAMDAGIDLWRSKQY
jgi:magnesium-dependent phosphatase-1